MTEKTASRIQILALITFKTSELYDIKVLCTFTYVTETYDYTSSVKGKKKKEKEKERKKKKKKNQLPQTTTDRIC
jgi:hypothetical protein